MESSLRTASEPRMPDSPAQPFMLADANPAALPAAPVPVLPDAQTADQGISVIPAKAGIQERDEVDPASALDPRMRGDDSLPLPKIPATPEGLASKLAQAEGAAANINLAVTPASLMRQNSDTHL